MVAIFALCRQRTYAICARIVYPNRDKERQKQVFGTIQNNVHTRKRQRYHRL